MTQRQTPLLYPTPFNKRSNTVLSLSELDALSISASIREKTNWKQKISDDDILAKWEREVLKGSDDKFNVFKYALDDVRWHQSRHESIEHEHEHTVANFDDGGVYGVHQSDDLVDDALLHQLSVGVLALEKTESGKDEHPGSDGKVIDLIHPSMYPFVQGVSRETVPFDGTTFDSWALSGKRSEKKKESWLSNKKKYNIFESKRFQWLPADFAVGHAFGEGTFKSYVNNLDPSNVVLLKSIERITARFVPLFERVLTDLRYPIQPAADMYQFMHSYSDYDSEEENERDEKEYDRALPPHSQNHDGDLPPRSIRLAGKELQIIVKMADTVLEPHTTFDGGAWHVEGMENERIVATGIYYWHVDDNLSESRLQFRRAVDKIDYRQDDAVGVRCSYGFESDAPMVQDVGSIVAKAGRCIAFPNTYQHRVAPFSLVDPKSRGVRRILALFLVDPEARVKSTSTVPPQQPHRIAECILRTSGLPGPAAAEIASKMHGVYDRATAEGYRAELMEERKFVHKLATEELFERPFSLCEH